MFVTLIFYWLYTLILHSSFYHLLVIMWFHSYVLILLLSTIYGTE